MIYRVIALIIKELQEQVSSARGVAVLIVPILIQTLIFPFVATQDITNCKVAVYCEDAGSQAVEFLQRLSAAPYISEVQMLYGDEQLRQALDKQLCMVGIHIPPTFSRHIARGATAPIQVIGDGQRSNSSQIAVGYVSAILNELYRPSTSATTPIVRHLYNPNLSYKWFILTCLFGMLGMITARPDQQLMFGKLLCVVISLGLTLLLCGVVGGLLMGGVVDRVLILLNNVGALI
jgi:ABC-2 type transport system permease protein